MVTAAAKAGNRLLDALPAKVLDALRPHLRAMPLRFGDTGSRSRRRHPVAPMEYPIAATPPCLVRRQRLSTIKPYASEASDGALQCKLLQKLIDL